MDQDDPINILVVGAGGREHALVRACLKSPQAAKVMAAPGNGGMATEIDCHAIPVEDVAALVALARAEGVGLVIVGPEVPLGLGLVDALEAAGIPAYGPGQAGAQLETSKAFCKDFFARHGIPTAAYATFTELEPALDYLRRHPAPVVVKASGLAAGKGVIMAETRAEAEAAVRELLEGGRFGESGREIVIEETLYGEEASIHAIVSGETYLCLPPSQDHKRVGEGDTGPNTGGMGAYAPASCVSPELQHTIEATVIRPTLAGLKADGIDYRGTLYAGLMLTEDGPKVLEYNVRFGDPETQVLLPLLADDLVPLLLASARGEPLPGTLNCFPAATMVVVLAARGYPGDYPKGEPITLPDPLPDGVDVLHAGTVLDAAGTLRTAGGRVLGVSAQVSTLADAATRAYAVCDALHFESKYFRSDIGHRELS